MKSLKLILLLKVPEKEVSQLSAKVNEISSVHNEIQNLKKHLANLQFPSYQVSEKMCSLEVDNVVVRYFDVNDVKIEK